MISFVDLVLTSVNSKFMGLSMVIGTSGLSVVIIISGQVVSRDDEEIRGRGRRDRGALKRGRRQEK